MSMLAHIGIDANPFAVTNPFKGFRQIILSFHIPLDIVAPFLRFRILGITKEEFYKLKYCSTVVYMVPRA